MKTKTILILLALLSFSCQTKKNTERKKATKYLQEIARMTNKVQDLPNKINEYTIAEKVTYDTEKNIITYSYILTEITADIANKAEIINSLNQIKFNQIKRVKENQGKDKAYQLLKVTINSVYKYSNGKEFYSYAIEPDQYLTKK